MESALSVTTTATTLFEALNNSHFAGAFPTATQCVPRVRVILHSRLASYNYCGFLRSSTFRSPASPLLCVSSSGGEPGDADPIVLHVGGMMCEGCAANVKRILENRPQVSFASVNLTTEIATVWPVSEAKVAPNWQKQLGEALAEHLTSCGFNSSLQGKEDSD